MTDDQKLTVALVAVVFLLSWLLVIAYRAISGDHLGE